MAEVKGRAKNWSTGRVKRPPNRRKQETFTPGDRRRLSQLVVCLFLFGIVFVGRGMPEGHLASLGNTIGVLIHENTDFRAAFSKVGQSVSEGEPFVETFGVLCSEVFGTGHEAKESENQSGAVSENADPNEETGETTQASDQMEANGEQSQGEEEVQIPQEEVQPESTEETAANTEEQSLADETVTPVMGVITSGFGYRTHPVDGEWKFHNGIDIMANEGTPILAFSSGEVDYIGESPAYGLYLQLKHDNQVTTFYAHCSEIFVKKGQKVAAGEEIGKVGSTGISTGSHLHFEMRKDGQRIDPASYVETLPQ